MKVGDLVKHKRMFRTFSTVTGQPLKVNSFGVVLKNNHKRKLTMVFWFQMNRVSWVPFRVVEVL